MDFPHMKESNFPHVGNVDVYKYLNEFDYSRYDDMQMHLQICSVPWDMGEAHIGNRTISGIGNVVWFETEEARDEWFDAIPDSECLRFDTKYKALHRDNQIVVPVPFDKACLFNYLVVNYEPFTGEGNYVEYEDNNGLRSWFWFIREVEFLAPNSTRLHLMNDAWQTFAYRMHFSGMILERGHAPLFATDVDTYLGNPIANNEMLLAEDVNFGGEPDNVKSAERHVFNNETWACFACTSNPSSNWGTKSDNNWRTPTLSNYTVDGVPNMRIFAMDVLDLNVFLSNMETQAPQFAQTVKGVFFAPKELITLGTGFEFCETQCYLVATTNHRIDLIEFEKSQFGYPTEYSELAKLYTYPYSALDVADENGNVTRIKIEETNGNLDISATMSLAYPAIAVQANLLGFGSRGGTSLTFTNITERSLYVGGRWYETLHTWNVPVFGIVQSSAKHNDYDTHFDRAQQVVSYTNTYNSTVESADTEKANAYASADTSLTNATNVANTQVTNASVQTAANTAITGAGNAATNAIADAAVSANNGNTANGNALTSNTVNNQINQQYASGAISAVSSVVTGAATGAMSGGLAGAGMGLVGGLLQAGTAAANTQAAVNLLSAQADATIAANEGNRSISNAQTNANASTSTSAATVKNTTVNNTITTTTANNAATQITNASNENATAKANADRTQATAIANAGRARNTAQNAITNQIAQAALGTPFEFGEFKNNSQATTRPMLLSANVVTQSKNAIKQTGDEFLRYGYFYNQQWNFNGNWNIGKHFTYWKLADFWVRGLNIPDMYVDKLRFFLYGGVTVWRKPEDIGNVTIYQNM